MSQLSSGFESEIAQSVSLIQAECSSVNSLYLKDLLNYVFSVQGKMMRPLMTYAAAHLRPNPNRESALLIATGLEVLHTASLVHDDIMDQGQTRRGLVTINVRNGIGPATLLGDWLLAKSFELITRVGDKRVIHGITVLTSELTEGQFLELEMASQKEVTESEYLKMIALKTGSIFRYCCRFGSYCNPNALAEDADHLDLFGQHFGLMFQIIDDLIDIFQSEQEAGKTTGVDLQNHLRTLPLILGLKREGKQGLLSRIASGEIPSRDHLRRHLMDLGVIQECLTRASDSGHRALEILASFDQGRARKILEQMVEMTLKNSNALMH